MQNSYSNQSPSGTNLACLTAQQRSVLLRQRKQAGLGLFSWLVVLGLAGFAVSIGLKVIPHYMDNRAIVGVVETMSPEVWRSSTPKRMLDTVDKGLKVNNIRTLKAKDVLKIDRTPSITKVNVDYEIRENLFGNVDVVLVFKKDYQY